MKPSKRFWYTAIARNSSGQHAVFYAGTRPRIGGSCPGLAGPNKIITFKRELLPK